MRKYNAVKKNDEIEQILNKDRQHFVLKLIIFLFASLLMIFSINQIFVYNDKSNTIEAISWTSAYIVIDYNYTSAQIEDLANHSLNYSITYFDDEVETAKNISTYESIMMPNWDASDYYSCILIASARMSMPTNVITELDLTNAKKAMKGFEIGNITFAGFDLIYPTEQYTKNVTTIASVDYTSSIGADGDIMYGIVLQAQWSESSLPEDTYSITYLNTDGTTLENNNAINPATYNEETETITLLAPEAPTNYVFIGWSETADGTPVRDYQIIKGTTGNITLYAHFALETKTITLQCTNYEKQNYMIYVYLDSKQVMQVYPNSETTYIKVPYTASGTYSVQFVYGYYGTIDYTTTTNATASNRKATLNSFADTEIIYTLSTPRLNGIVV